MTNNYEIKKLSTNDRFIIFKNYTINIDKYITFLKDNLDIDKNELLIIIDLTIYSKFNHLLLKDKCNNINFKKVFMYNYKRNIKYLRKYIKIKRRTFNSLVSFLSNKKRIYSYFENINDTNISFYLPIILNIEYPNS